MEWISVKERLPTKIGLYYIVFETDGFFPRFSSCGFWDSKWVFPDWLRPGVNYGHIIYWMYKPKIPDPPNA
jgi:hypothetical protein